MLGAEPNFLHLVRFAIVTKDTGEVEEIREALISVPLKEDRFPNEIKDALKPILAKHQKAKVLSVKFVKSGIHVL